MQCGGVHPSWFDGQQGCSQLSTLPCFVRKRLCLKIFVIQAVLGYYSWTTFFWGAPQTRVEDVYWIQNLPVFIMVELCLVSKIFKSVFCLSCLEYSEELVGCFLLVNILYRTWLKNIFRKYETGKADSAKSVYRVISMLRNPCFVKTPGPPFFPGSAEARRDRSPVTFPSQWGSGLVWRKETKMARLGGSQKLVLTSSHFWIL